MDSSIESVPRISPAYRKRLNKLGIKNLRDLFYHFPFRYDDFSNIRNIRDLTINETATIQGEIIEIKNQKTWRKKMFITQAYIKDKTGTIKAIWFNQPYLTNTLKQTDIVSLAGKINFDKTLYLSNPAYEKLTVANKWQTEKSNATTINHLRHTGGLIPVYPETTGLSSRWLRFIIKTLLPKFLPQLKDYLPLEIRRSQSLLDINRAIQQIHFPTSAQHVQAAKKRLAFDELFLIQLFVLQQKSRWQKQSALKISFNQSLVKKFVDSLPFQLTDCQRKSAWEILQDLAKSKPMNRLLEGDVGSGKTVVAAIAAIETVKAGWQVAFMAPTEILAQQHFKTIAHLIKNHNITIGLLTGSESKKAAKLQVLSLEKKELIEQVLNGQIQILIGTHALIQETVSFKNLALVVVDEQHRFGVGQRAALQKDITKIEDGQTRTIPHLLSMTATPIPRTLALTIFGDLDISLLDQMPKGRQQILTKIIPPDSRQKAYEFIKQQIEQGRQVFVICPRIEIVNSQSQVANQNNINDMRLAISDKRTWDDVKAVKEEYEKLNKVVFPDLRISMLHGKLKPREKEKIMSDFKAGKSDILVSTSVIEVGIDIPNATVMMIEGAERFGLAQLHQFRGRVGRGSHQSYCLLFTTSGDGHANRRLIALVKSNNGFELAEKDLEIRGPGQLYGNRQWGLPDLSMASLSDLALVKAARQQAQLILQKDPDLIKYPLLKQKISLYQQNLHLE